MHAFLSNIELRTMNEENKSGAEMEIVEVEWNWKTRIEERNLSIKRTKLVTMTDITTMRVEGRNVKPQ